MIFSLFRCLQHSLCWAAGCAGCDSIESEYESWSMVCYSSSLVWSVLLLFLCFVPCFRCAENDRIGKKRYLSD